MNFLYLGLAAFLGLLFNLSFAGQFVQPDWCFSILLAVLLSRHETWFWVLPLLGLHDFLMFWSVWVTFPFVLLSTGILMYADTRLAPGQPQRWAALFLSCSPLLLAGLDITSWLLTLTLTIWLWFLLSTKREKVYVEPV